MQWYIDFKIHFLFSVQFNEIIGLDTVLICLYHKLICLCNNFYDSIAALKLLFIMYGLLFSLLVVICCCHSNCFYLVLDKI